MHEHDLRPFHHPHVYGDGQGAQRERVLVQVTVLTLVAMVVELLAGWWSGSLALTADGWHMGTHALALGGAALAYRLSARAQHAPGGQYAFGGWKIEVLAAYTSALALGVVAVWLIVAAVQTLLSPRPIAYLDAMVVAVVGLAVNGVSAWMMTRGGVDTPGHDHGHGHDHPHDHGHGHDQNFSAAYLHVLADALTSVLAIVALAGGLWLGWAWLDPAVAVLGALLIGSWSIGLLRSSTRALVDATGDPALAGRIRQAVECDGDARLADLHVWQVGSASWSVVLTVVADRPLAAAVYRERLAALAELGHVTVEVHRCPAAATG
ncbi:MAG: CDF family Co(II)/Ni(II) efflux transporter DmeF [Rubrivivax sp.]|nr:CDF family Co(II)/Ni(II) efflux transporter DmeF [Rubrivivax sp.]